MKHEEKLQSSVCPKQVKTRANLLLKDVAGKQCLVVCVSIAMTHIDIFIEF